MTEVLQFVSSVLAVVVLAMAWSEIRLMRKIQRVDMGTAWCRGWNAGWDDHLSDGQGRWTKNPYLKDGQ